MSTTRSQNVLSDDSTFLVSADRERIALGTEDGLFVVEVTRDGETDRQTFRRVIIGTCLTF